MEPALRVALAWLLFAASHIGLAALPVRGPLVRRLGRWGFLAAYSAVAAATFALAVSTYAAQHLQGAPGLSLGRSGPAAAALAACVVLGWALMLASLAEYPRSPMSLSGEQASAPYGLARVTRHPFFAGLILFAGAHALLASHLAGAVGMAGLALVAAVGAWHQDRKLLALRGESYRAYLAATSALPFAAILAGRQRLAWRELPRVGLAVGLATAYLLRAVHGSVFDHGGAYVIGTVVGGSFLILAAELRRDRRARAPAARRAMA
jgi:uncharacterized membrane protein